MPENSAAPTPPRDTATFVQLLTGCQSSLYAYVVTLLGSATDAADVVQETNAVLWEKAGEYDISRPFLPWAFRFAHWQVLAYRKRHARARLICDDSLLAEVAAEYEQQENSNGDALDALRGCLEKLTHAQRDLVVGRYQQTESVEAAAARLGESANTISARLYRIRKNLMLCVESTLAVRNTP